MSYLESRPELFSDFQKIVEWPTFLVEQLAISPTFIYAENSIIESAVLFHGNAMEHQLVFENCYFKSTVVFGSLTCKYQVRFLHCYFDNLFFVGDNTVFEDTFSLLHCSSKNILQLDSSSFQNCNLHFKECNSIWINDCTFTKLDCISIAREIKEFKIRQPIESTNEKLSFNFANNLIQKVEIYGANRDSQLSLRNFCTNQFAIYNFSNEGILRLWNISAGEKNQSRFSVIDSNLGAAEFNSIDFSTFSCVNICKSSITDCSFINITWKHFIHALTFSRQENESDPTLSEKIDALGKSNNFKLKQKHKLISDPDVMDFYKKQRETYRQLKFALGKQGDIISEQFFHSLEMTSYYHSLRWHKDFWTKTILKLSYWTSNYGQSILRPIIWLFSVHFIMFCIALAIGQFPPLHIDIAHINKSGFWTGFNVFFETINPFRTTKSGQSFVPIDQLMRIWSSYMIYNFIRASRRFIK